MLVDAERCPDGSRVSHGGGRPWRWQRRWEGGSLWGAGNGAVPAHPGGERRGSRHVTAEPKELRSTVHFI